MNTSNAPFVLRNDLPAVSTPEFPQVIRRDLPGDTSGKPRVVPWLGHKIAKAVSAACFVEGQDDQIGVQVQAEIEYRLRRERPSFVHIEQLQDMVEETLIDLGHAKVALVYGKYRARRAAEREHGIGPVIEDDGQQLELATREQLGDIRARISFAKIGLKVTLNDDDLLARLLRSTSISLTPVERRDTIVLNAKSLLDVDADARFFAARILLSYIYEETLPWKVADGPQALKEAHRKAFLEYIPRGIALGRLEPRLAEFDLKKLATALDPFADLQFDFLGIQTLYDRYLIHTHDSVTGRKQRMEAPQVFWMRVAMGLSVQEPEREERAGQFYGIYKSRRACSSTPTLFNAGTMHPQLSSCYLLYCGDSIEEITETWRRFSHLSKWAGGLGCSWTAIRGAGAHIHGTNGESSGVIPFLKVSNDIAIAVNQGGKRPGALCSYLELWHADIEDFLDLRKETGDDRRRTHNMNTAHWIPDLFMKRLKAISDGTLTKEATWSLFRTSETPDLPELSGRAFEERYLQYEALAAEGKLWSRKVRVLALWKRMLEMLFETGHPWMTFKDPCNLRSPQDHTGVIHNSNLCTEITLNTSSDEVAVCNLASINLAAHLREDGALDHDRLRATITVLMRMLDNVIDINFYPVDAAANANLRHRPVGLGLMGLQDALYDKGIAFDTPEAVAFNDEALEAIAYYAYEASSDLAAERGRYQTYAGSKWDRGLMPLDTLAHLEQQRGVPLMVDRTSRLDWTALRQKIAQQGMRNSNCLAIAPTATISNILGARRASSRPTSTSTRSRT
ncbi:ribonucleoside-diphosphate reductase, alpha subunit [Chthoniobacter flavus Ellin428]|uniref:Ribonucleoside-diphosphate reductase n=1 Tax=Chthoniobacter flavus Ellin428 TaxID=497964 RepID=B4CZD2_9BACT|nr:ribonucleoside-diphosphate reductase subunit alpha [Chthoniobacter flavus]EDY20823.1 ribonucleoside-diphosphate reductase, alpha subunit [Chthoniobacter flavus Ellin428]